MSDPMLAWADSPSDDGTPTPVDRGRSDLVARLRELGRIAAALDTAAIGADLREPRVRLARGAHAGAEHPSWSSQPTVTAELLLGDLARHGVTVARRRELQGASRGPALAAYERLLQPMLTPLTLDRAHPLPRARLRGLLVVGTLAPAGGETRARLTLVPLPPRCARWIRLDHAPRDMTFAPAEELVRVGLAAMFPDELVETHALRIVRAADADGPHHPAFLEHEPGAPRSILERLGAELRLEPGRAHATDGLLGLADLGALCDAIERA